MSGFEISLNSAEVVRVLEQETPRKVRNALRSSIRTTTTWANKELDRRMAEDTQLPVRVFKDHRIFKSTPLDAEMGIESGRLWFGYRRVAAKHAGNPVQLRGRLRVGKYNFPRGFMWRGHVFQRSAEKFDMTKGRYLDKKRQRIEKQYIDLPNAQAISQQVTTDAGVELQRRFLQKFTSAGSGE